jgi:RNA polymerase sigma-70 factor (ECF subfamily)
MHALIIERTLRRERARLVASLYRLARDLELVEDAVQEASLDATLQWAQDGLPDNPGAWLYVVVRRRAIDLLRRRRRHRELEVAEATAPSPPGAEEDRAGRLRLLLACCSAALPERARMALALRTFLGLSTREIARAFVEPETTTAQRLVRARRTLKRQPPGEGAAPAPGAFALVLRVVYLTFNEGYLAAEDEALVRRHLLEDALDLGTTIVELVPDDPESWALLALMHLHSSRRDARVDGSGRLLTLEEQDRSRWDVEAIARGTAALERALSLHRGERTGTYQLQAAIASLHATTPSAATTDWVQIAALYRRLLDFEPSPIVELNAGIALAMSGDVEGGLRWLNALERRGALKRSHLFASAKGLLLAETGALSQARRYLGRARALATNDREREYLTRRISALEATRRGVPPAPDTNEGSGGVARAEEAVDVDAPHGDANGRGAGHL